MEIVALSCLPFFAPLPKKRKKEMKDVGLGCCYLPFATFPRLPSELSWQSNPPVYKVCVKYDLENVMQLKSFHNKVNKYYSKEEKCV